MRYILIVVLLFVAGIAHSTEVKYLKRPDFKSLGKKAPKEKPFNNKGYRVVATVMTSATGGARLASLGPNDANSRIFVALPSRQALGRTIYIYCPETNRWLKGVPVLDCGPHSTNDPYWVTHTRPLAESGVSQKYGKAKNKAGIDLSLRLAHALGLSYPYKGIVIWEMEPLPVKPVKL